jgi:hypothetical protein
VSYSCIKPISVYLLVCVSVICTVPSRHRRDLRVFVYTYIYIYLYMCYINILCVLYCVSHNILYTYITQTRVIYLSSIKPIIYNTKQLIPSYKNNHNPNTTLQCTLIYATPTHTIIHTTTIQTHTKLLCTNTYKLQYTLQYTLISQYIHYNTH